VLTQEELEKISEPIQAILKGLEEDVINSILKRMSEVPEIIRSTDFEIWKLNQLGSLKSDVKNQIQKRLKLTNEEMDKIFKDWVSKGYARNKELYTATGKEFTPLEENPQLLQFIDAVAQNTKGTAENMTNTTGFIIDKQFLAPNKAFIYILDKCTTEIATGTFSYTEALKNATTQLTNSGLKTIDYDSGWKNRVDVAVRRAVVTGLHQIENRIADDVAQDLETEMFEVSAHLTARPTHQEWQGKVYTKNGLETICGLGDKLGLGGINCYHRYYPFVEGVSERAYTDKELGDMKRKANLKRIWNGKDYTTYEATQRQRALETNMRALGEEIQYLKRYGGEKTDIQEKEVKFNALMSDYNGISKMFDLPTRPDRIWIRNAR